MLPVPTVLVTLLSFPCNSRTVMILNLSSAWVHKQQMSSMHPSLVTFTIAYSSSCHSYFVYNGIMMSCYIYNNKENSVSCQRCFMSKFTLFISLFNVVAIIKTFLRTCIVNQDMRTSLSCDCHYCLLHILLVWS